VGHVLALLHRRSHDGSLDGQKLVREPDFVRKVQLLFQALVVGEKATEVHERDAEEHHQRRSQPQTIDRSPPPSDESFVVNIRHGTHPSQKGIQHP
jgi:hypothetical protein